MALRPCRVSSFFFYLAVQWDFQAPICFSSWLSSSIWCLLFKGKRIPMNWWWVQGVPWMWWVLLSLDLFADSLIQFDVCMCSFAYVWDECREEVGVTRRKVLSAEKEMEEQKRVLLRARTTSTPTPYLSYTFLWSKFGFHLDHLFSNKFYFFFFSISQWKNANFSFFYVNFSFFFSLALLLSANTTVTSWMHRSILHLYSSYTSFFSILNNFFPTKLSRRATNWLKQGSSSSKD